MRILRLFFAAGLLTMLLVSATGALAAPHDTAGNWHTACVTDGYWFRDTGISFTPTEGLYILRDPHFYCSGQEGGVYEIFAQGHFTDFAHAGDGATCLQGGSVQDSATGELHTGELDAFQGATQVFDGNMHFARLGGIVLADGPLTKLADGTQHFFQAELVLQHIEGECRDRDGVTESLFDGTVEIYGEPFVHDCTQDGQTHDEDCDVS